MITGLHSKVFACLAGAMAILPLPASAVSDQQVDQCENKSKVYSLDIVVVACTAAIQSGQWSGKDLVWAYVGRGTGYRGKGDLDRAIADFNQAITLDPKYAPTYYDRGNAYWGKGDIDRAIADFTGDHTRSEICAVLH